MRYTAAKNERAVDKYTAGGAVGQRPDHATAVYAQLVKKLWPDMPVVIGGIEASLRRFVHFDYWENKLMPSILEASGADLLVYGMGEKQIMEIADYLAGGASAEDMHYIRGTAYMSDTLPMRNMWSFPTGVLSRTTARNLPEPSSCRARSRIRSTAKS